MRPGKRPPADPGVVGELVGRCHFNVSGELHVPKLADRERAVIFGCRGGAGEYPITVRKDGFPSGISSGKKPADAFSGRNF